MFFRFNEPVYCLVDSDLQQFPSESKEVRARWVSVFENVDGPMIWKIVTEKHTEGFMSIRHPYPVQIFYEKP